MSGFNISSFINQGTCSRAQVAETKLPFLVWVVLFFTMVAFYGGNTLFGYNLSGFGWVVPLGFSLLILSRNFKDVTFPYLLWVPWALLLFTYLVVADYATLDVRVSPVQRTIQLLAPIFTGMAMSTFRPTPAILGLITQRLRQIAIILFSIVLIKLSSKLVAGFGDYSGMAAEVMTVTLLCTLFANRFLLYREKRDLLLWGLMAVVPVINITRTAIVATLLTFPLAFGPLKLPSRIIILAFLALVGLAMFYTPRMQQKMFYSGKGTLSDIRSENFATSGRSYMWEKMRAVADEEPLTGHGTGAGETFVYAITGKTAYPHNDWLLTYYDYGVLGLFSLGLSLMLAVGHALSCLRMCRAQGTRLLFLAGASAFVPFCLLMTTDNILVYAAFFGNLHFTFLGLAYGALRKEQTESPDV